MDLFKFMKKLDVTSSDACRSYRLFCFCQLHFSGADKAIYEWVDFFFNSFLDFCPIVAYIL